MSCSLLLQYFTGLECGHKFCMQCWSEYLTTKIMEEGMGQVKCQLAYLMTYFWKFCVLERRSEERGEFFPTKV